MNKFALYTVAALAFLGASGLQIANAALIIDSTPRNASDVALALPMTIPQGSGSGVLSWRHNLNFDSAWTIGDIITLAELEIIFQDANGNETLTITAESSNIGTVTNIVNNGVDVPFEVTFNSTINTSLETDGILDISISWTANANTAFILVGSTLTVETQGEVETETPVTSIPEPVSLALFGAGLAGLGLLRRRKSA